MCCAPARMGRLVGHLHAAFDSPRAWGRSWATDFHWVTRARLRRPSKPLGPPVVPPLGPAWVARHCAGPRVRAAPGPRTLCPAWVAFALDLAELATGPVWWPLAFSLMKHLLI